MRDRDPVGVVYRRARPSDRARVMRVLESANFHNIPSPEMPDFDLALCFVAEVEGRIVGVAGYQRRGDGSGKTTLIAVLPEARGTGVGRHLQELRMLALRELGCRTVTTNADLQETIDWYKRHFGYEEIGSIPKLHEFGAPDIDHWTTLRADIEHWYRYLRRQRVPKQAAREEISLDAESRPPAREARRAPPRDG